MKQSESKLSKCIRTCTFFYKEAIKERKGYPVFIILYILISALAPFINILVPKYIIEELTGTQNITNIAGYVLLIVLGNYIIGGLIRILQESRAKQEDWFARKFDMMMSEKAMFMKFENTEKESALEAQQKAEIGMSWYSGGIRGMSDCVIGICSALLTFGGVVCIVTRISPWLFLAALGAVCVETFCTSKINQASQEVFEKTPAINKFYSYIYTRISNREYAKELRLYAGTDIVEKKAMDNAKALNVMDNECARKQFGWGIPGAIVSAVSYGFSYCYLGIGTIRGELTIAEFVMCITAIETFSGGCLQPLISHTQQLVMKCNFMDSFIRFMNLDDGEKTGDRSINREGFDEICFDGVSFKYPGSDQYILQDINFTIHKGERISIVGLNGAGKSTLVKLICRLYDVTEGEIRIGGRNIKEYRYEDYIRILAVVFQDFKLFGYTLDENIRIGAEKEIKTGVVNENDASQELKSIYETSGIAQWVNELSQKGNTLLGKEFDEAGVEPSGGQAQKIAIARALYCNAPVVILDEPTAALDPVAEYEIYNRFHQLIHNRTAIYISHRLSSCKFCDKIIVLADKTIREVGSHEELMERNGSYAEMFRTQAKWYVEEG